MRSCLRRGRTVAGIPLRVTLLSACVLGFGLGLGAPAPVEAQLSPADSAAVLLQAAADFERQGRGDVAEAIYEFILERFGGTPAATTARARLTGPQGQRVDRTSRVELPVFGTMYGLWLGVAIPLALNETDSQAYGLGLLVGGPVGLFSARAYNNSRRPSEGQARAISWGGIWGTWQGFGLVHVLDLGTEQYCDFGTCYEYENNDEEIMAGMIFGGLAGIGTGAIIANNPVRSGVSSAAQGGSIWGSIYGAMVAEMFDPVGEDKVIATSLIAGNVGLLTGALLAKKYDVGRPRIRMINLGALVGGLAGLGIDLLVEPDRDETLIAIPLVTSIGGLVAATVATRGSRPEIGGSEPGMDGALFGYTDGAFSLNAPLPVPTLLPFDDVNGRPAWRPGLTVELFRARF